MQQIYSPGGRGRFTLSLPAQVSLLLVLIALLPLIITITSSEFLTRPELITQANASMETDAQTHILAIETYFSQPIIDVRALSQNASLAAYLGGDNGAADDATRVLATGYQHNMNYVSWSLIDAQGKQRLFYPIPPLPHGRYFIPPETIKQLSTTNNAAISSDYYNPQGNMLTIDITEPVLVFSANTRQVPGYLRATLNINFIWDMIQSEKNANGAGSYAFIADENGVVVTHTDISKTFTALAPFTPAQQANITTLQRYGSIAHLPVWPHSALSDKVNRQMPFQLTFQSQHESYQVIGMPIFVVPWTYFVLSPTRVVTALADRQLFTIGLIGIAVLILAALIGILVGKRITSPVLRSASQLQTSSQHLKALAAREQVTLAQQAWMVESSKTGLSSFSYYLDASQNAMNHMVQIGKMLENYWASIGPEERQRALRQIFITTHYIDTALQQQQVHGRKLAATLDLTQQVTDQLNASAAAAAQAAEQMEMIINQLQKVVGKPGTIPGQRL